MSAMNAWRENLRIEEATGRILATIADAVGTLQVVADAICDEDRRIADIRNAIEVVVDAVEDLRVVLERCVNEGE